jgi:hypothetical protein
MKCRYGSNDDENVMIFALEVSLFCRTSEQNKNFLLSSIFLSGL